MLKLFILSVLVASTVALPRNVGLLNGDPNIRALLQSQISAELNAALIAQRTQVQLHEPTLAKVGDILEHDVPNAISHQSSTIVHSRGPRLTPILTPAVRTYTTPLIRTYAATLLQQQQQQQRLDATTLLRSLPISLSPAAAFVHAHAPLQLRTYTAAAPLAYTNAYNGYTYGSPLVYATSA